MAPCARASKPRSNRPATLVCRAPRRFPPDATAPRRGPPGSNPRITTSGDKPSHDGPCPNRTHFSLPGTSVAFAARSVALLSPRYRARALARLQSRRRDDANGCWLYDGARTAQGYGHFALKPFGAVRAHAASWLLSCGDIPANTDVCHRCNVQACFNPNHLYLACRSENVQHAVRDRLTKHHGYRGARITDDEVREIRARYAAGKVLQRELAEAFRVDQQIVSRIVNRTAFRWVDARA